MFGHFESRKDKLAPMDVFLFRVLKSLSMAFYLIGTALLIGIMGYHWLAGFDWIDSLLEASMILGGMGPIKELHTSGAKVFASIYALFSGIVFIGVMGFVLAPLAHRVLHKFHIDEQDEAVKKRKK